MLTKSFPGLTCSLTLHINCISQWFTNLFHGHHPFIPSAPYPIENSSQNSGFHDPVQKILKFKTVTINYIFTQNPVKAFWFNLLNQIYELSPMMLA